MTSRKAFAALIITAFLPLASLAADSKPLLEQDNLAIGAGLALNSVNGPVDDELGLQFFAAYELDKVNLAQGVNTAIEIGYMDYGFDGRNDGGLWINAVIGGGLTRSLGWLARAGLDLGDDDGIMLGGGLEIPFDNSNALRFEYVIRDNIDSLQLNFVHQL